MKRGFGIERRSMEVRVTPVDDGPKQDGLSRQFWAKVVSYNVEDDYGTAFRQGCFNDYLEQRYPRVAFGHSGWDNLQHVLGRGIDHRDGKDGLEVLFQLDDFEYVPLARQFAYQVREGTIDEWSVGFKKRKTSRDSKSGVTWVEKADLPEVSGVLMGAVPGTRTLSLRSGNGDEDEVWVSRNFAANLLARMSLGELDLHEALTELKSAFVEDDEDVDGSSAEGDDAPEEEAEQGDGTGDAPGEPEVEPTSDPETPTEEEVVDDDPFVDDDGLDIDEILAGVRSTPRPKEVPAPKRVFHGNQHAHGVGLSKTAAMNPSIHNPLKGGGKLRPAKAQPKARKGGKSAVQPGR